MAKHHNKYELAIHFGLLAIIILLLALNLVSNYITYRARIINQEDLTRQFRAAGLAVNRTVLEEFPVPLSESLKTNLTNQYSLNTLLLTPSRPTKSTAQAKHSWLSSLAHRLPQGHLPGMIDKLSREEYHQLARGSGDEYFYVYPLTVRSGPNLLIMSKASPDLAYLDDSRELLSILLPMAIVIVLVAYLVLSKFIFSPFRKIKEQAARAGRRLEDDENEAEAVVEEYKQVIGKLKQKEAELMKLNASIQDKADVLEQFNQYLLSSSSSGIITLDPQGQVMSLNQSACRILGLEFKDHCGLDSEILFHSSPQLLKFVRAALRDGVFDSYREITLTHEPSQKQVAGVIISPIEDNKGQRVGVSILLNDLTELAILRYKVEQKNRLISLGEMAGGLAHQIRNSMGAITGYGNLVKRRLVNCGQPVENIEALLQETNEAEELIGRFLDFARPFNFAPAPLRLEQLLEEVIQSFRVREDCRDVEFSLSVEINHTIDADGPLLKQAVANIIDNGVQACPNRFGVIETTCFETNGNIQIEIKDSGSGIPKENLDKIFTPFFSSRPSGTGLGLPLASKIINLHGGRITVDSEVDQGTTYCINLPSIRVQPPDADNRTVDCLR